MDFLKKVFGEKFKMNNEELIQKYEDSSIEYTKLLKIIITKKINGEINDKEWKTVQEIASRSASIILDTISQNNKVNQTELKEEIKKGIQNAVNECMDENR